MTGASPGAIELYEQAVAQFNRYIGDPVATVEAALADSPRFAMGHALRAYLLLSGTERGALALAARSVASLRELPLNEREQRHAAAATSLLHGAYQRACEQLDAILVDDPRDIVALQVGHLFDFYRGDSRNLRDRVARVLPDWSAAVPGYHAVLGMYAFGLEETGHHDRAEVVGRRAVALEPRDGWAHHAVAHVMEMTNRHEDGAAWLMSGMEDWSRESFFAVHNTWHLAVFLLEADDVEGALRLYDGAIRGGESAVVLDMIDASALLWRLGLRGVDVGDRWQALADRWQPLIDDRLYAFNDVHALMALLSAGREEAAGRLMATLAETAQRPGDNGAMAREVGLPLARALLDFHRGRYAAAVEALWPLRSIAHRFGGSHAQRDLLDLTALEAAARSGHRGQLRALANERLERRPHSPLARRYRQRALDT